MNKLKKIGLTALASSLIAGTASAGDLSATGSASMTFSGGDDKKTTGQGWTMGDSVTFSGSGDVNGIDVTLSIELDGDAADGTNQLDSHSIKFGLGDMGTLTFAGHGGSSALGMKDDVVPQAYQEPWDVVTGAEADVIGGGGGNNNFLYTYSHDSGVTVNASYTNAADAVTDVSYSDIGVEYTGVDGLVIGWAQGDVETTTNTKKEQTTMYAKYTMGPISIGVQTSENDQTGATNDRDTTGVGISYAVSDELSVSYGEHTIEYNSGSDQQASAVSVSYTMGSLTVAGSMHSVDNIANSASNDREAYEINLAFAF